MFRIATPLALILALVLHASISAAFTPRAEKTASTFHGPEKRAIVKANAERYEWARAEVAKAVNAASPYRAMSNDDLWRLVLSPTLKRALAVNESRGCPSCGHGIYGDRGPSLYAFNAQAGDWKIQCPNCREIFPKNDFGKFHASGISPEDGLFHYERADQSLLYNEEHPDPNDPKHTWCVDDGNGWIAEDDSIEGRDWFVAVNVYRVMMQKPFRAFGALARAYAVTGEPEYAEKALVMLDRIADVYWRLDGKNQQFVNNVWNSYSGGIIGPNYWEGTGWARMAESYDMIYDALTDDSPAVAFIRQKSKAYTVPGPKETAADIRNHIEQRVLIDRFSKPDSYSMNGTISQMCEARVDLVLRGQKAIDEFAAVHMPRIVPETNLNRDGSGNERSISYDHGAFGNYIELLIDLYDMDPQLARNVLDANPNLKALFDFWPDIWVIDGYLPNIGDSHGGPGFRSGIPVSPAPYAILYDLYRDPRYAEIASLAAGGDFSSLPRNLFAAEPDRLYASLAESVKGPVIWDNETLVKPDYRLGILRAGQEGGKDAVTFFYSPHPGTSSHSHFDALTFQIFAYGIELLIDHGYPLFTGGWPSRWEWTSHTRSHALVTVDGSQQNHCIGGDLLALAAANGVQVISAEAPCVYDSVDTYRRTLVLAPVSDGRHVLVDFFFVRGGRQHIYSIPFHYGEMTVTGLDLAPAPDFYGGYVEEVQSGPASDDWMADVCLRDKWEGEHTAHLRVHGTAQDAEFIAGRGETRLGDEHPERLPYLFLKRDGENIETLFVHVFEPYRETPLLPEKPLALEMRDGDPVLTIRIQDGRSLTLATNIVTSNETRVDVTARDGESVNAFSLSGIHYNAQWKLVGAAKGSPFAD